MDIMEMAKDLARAIQQDQRYLNMVDAKENNDKDDQLQEMMKEFNMLRVKLNNEVSKEDSQEPVNQDRKKEIEDKIDQVYADIMSNNSMVKYAQAKEELDTVVKKINTMLAYAVNGMDPEMAESSGCGGSCSSCAGCH